jgi:Cu2+-containing amine oxidase
MPGSVSYADWSLSWSIPSLNGEGLVISKADYKGRRVLFRAGAPFVLVPYHSNSPTFKDGLAPQCGGLPFLALKPTAPNVPSWELPPGSLASNDNQYNAGSNPGGAVLVEQLPAGWTEPAKLVLWAKLQCGNYQYIHRWEFQADGTISAEIGLGGRLLRFVPAGTVAHIHNFYFRLDFDIDGSANNQVERLAHLGLGTGQDQWTPILTEGKQAVNPGQFTKWRVRNKAAKANGQSRSYELVPGSDGAADGTYSTGDVWVLRYISGGEDGASVGCTDNVLETNYASGQSIDGEDVVVWYCLREHHTPRPLGEETNVLTYHFDGFHIAPRDFLDETPKNLYTTTPPSPL